GTGMAFRRAVLGRVRWETASPVEDSEYDAQLRAAGVRVRFCDAAVVQCESPTTVAALCRQRRRWRAARGTLGRKPLRLAHLALTVALCAATGLFLGWAAALLLATGAVYLRALIAVGVTWRRLGLLLKSPAIVLRLIEVALAGLIARKPTGWDRTPRLGE